MGNFLKELVILNENRKKSEKVHCEDSSISGRLSKNSRRDDTEQTYTIDEAIEKLGFGPFQFKIALISGIILSRDTMEIMLLSILGSALGCEWLINKWEVAFLSTTVFIGWGLGGPLWGKFCDIYGRRMGLLVSTFFTFYFGLLSSLAPNFIWLLMLRIVVGFGVGGSAQTFTLLSEFSPKEMRTKSALWLLFFRPIGSSFTIGLAIFIMQSADWRWLLAISSLHSFVVGILCQWLPESPRYHIENGRADKALDTLREISIKNKIRLPRGTLQLEPKSEVVGRARDLVRDKRAALITAKLWVIWFTNAFMFYGIVLLAKQM